MSSRDAQDAQVRGAACDPGESVLLQAPAGSGKTSVLTARLLRLLGAADEPEEILAITFTRKAAAEMRARVAAALAGQIALSGAAGAHLAELAARVRARSQQRGWQLAQNPARLPIQTIDAFNFRLAAQLPLAARVGGALTVTDRAQGLYLAAARQTLLAAEADRELAADIDVLFTRLDNQWAHLEALLAAMLATRAHWLPHVLSQAPAALPARVSASLAHLTRSQLAAACALLPAALRERAGALPGVAAALGDEAALLPAWQALAARVLTARGEWRAPKGISRTLGPEYGEAEGRERLREVLEALRGVAGARERLGEIAALPPCALPQEDQAALAALSRVLQVAAAQLQTQMARAGRVDHVYVGGAARAALADAGLPTELALRIGFSLRHILVDEFQDTSLAQWDLLRALTAGWQEGDGRTLFVVGDPMQSIYQFREAEVGLFIQARAQGIGGVRLTPLTLTRNFRSDAALIEWINRTCAPLFAPEDDVQASAVAYTPSRPGAGAPPDLPAAPVRLALLPGRCAEAAWIGERIAGLRARDAAATIAVLVAARGHAGPVLAALAARGIPAIGVDLTPLAGLPVIRDLVALTRALHQPGDRTAWLSVLRAPWCGVSLASLTALAQGPDGGCSQEGPLWQALTDPARLSACHPEDARRLGRVRVVLAAALARRGRSPLGEWLEQTWMQLGAADAYTAGELPHARAYFSALTDSAALGEWRGPDDLGPLLAGLYAQPVVSGDNPVSVMTIHRAKGLEFDHVLLPALDRGEAHGREPLLRWLDLPRVSQDGGTPGSEPGSDLLMAAVPAVDGQGSGELGRYLKRLQQRRQQHEQVRLLYVALTRARHSLHLSASAPRQADGQVRPRAGTLLARLWPVRGQDFEIHTAEPAAAPVAPAAPLRRLVPGWQPAPLPAGVAISSLVQAAPVAAVPPFSWAGEGARHIGTVAHAALCALAGEGELPQEAALLGRRALYSEQLRRLGVAPKDLEHASGEVLQVLLRTLADARGRWIFDRSHREAASGLALTGLVAGRLAQVVIDRCFVDAQGTRWVLDFKTSRHAGGGLAAFLEREVERHRGQLRRSAALARGLGPEPVRAALYFPLLQAFREVPASQRRAAARS
jgi:ATP-dependent helicase/nuclease subunit A